MVILDTNIIIDHLRQAGRENSVLQRFVEHGTDNALAISVITIQELYVGQSTKDVAKELQMLSVLSKFNVLPYNNEVATYAGKLARDVPNGVSFADSAIAATAMLNNASLLTLNRKHFQSIKDLRIDEFL